MLSRLRALLVFLALVTASRSFVACSHELDPGDGCEGSALDGLFGESHCPSGYLCSDSDRCEKEPNYAYDGSTYTPPVYSTVDASTDERDAGEDQ